MIGFHELRCPSACTDGRWYVYAICPGMIYYLLNYNYHLDDFAKIADSEFWFDTEVLAHVHASNYYLHNNRRYPWFDQWRLAVAKELQIDDSTTEAKVMEFI